jgi:hypothetical protein
LTAIGHGTTTLFAALDLATGMALNQCQRRIATKSTALSAKDRRFSSRPVRGAPDCG